MEAPKGKHIFGTVKVGEKGQIVIPKDAREVFDIHPGDSLVVLGDEGAGIAILKNDAFMAQVANAIFRSPHPPEGATESDPAPGAQSYEEIKQAVMKQAKE